MLSQGEAQLLEEDRLQGQLRIGASDTICRYFLIDYLKRFHQDYPECGSRSQTAPPWLRGASGKPSGGPDRKQSSQFPAYRTHKVQMVKEFRDIFVANPDFFPLEGKALEIKKLMEYPLLTLSSKSTTSEYLHQFLHPTDRI